MQTINVQYNNPDLPKLEKIEVGDWIDVYVDRIKMTSGPLEGNTYLGLMHISAGESFKIYLGFCLELPEGFEAHLVPRGSTFGKKGIIQTNNIGIIDNSFAGPEDEWWVPVYALRDCKIDFGDKLFQFRICDKQPPLKFNSVKKLTKKNRGSDGSTDI